MTGTTYHVSAVVFHPTIIRDMVVVVSTKSTVVPGSTMVLCNP